MKSPLLGRIARLALALSVPITLHAGLPAVPASISPTESFDPLIFDDEDRVVGIDFDLNGHSVTFFPDPEHGYTYLTQPIERFPVDLSEVEQVEYEEIPDSNVEVVPVTLTKGSFPFYGTPRSSFTVTDFGTIRFEGEGSFWDWEEVGIAFLAIDSNLAQSEGLVRVVELDDKVIVQIDGVREIENPHDFKDFANSVQAELFFDGRIRLSYFCDGFEFGTVGLSNGSDPGPGGFPEEDFASHGVKTAARPANEDEPFAMVEVTLAQTYPVPVSFGYAAADGTAREGSDYSTVSGIATIPANTMGTTISIPLLDDNLAEQDEWFLLKLSHPAHPGWQYGETKVWIVDNESGFQAGGVLANQAPRIRLAGTKVYIEAAAGLTAAFRMESIGGGSLTDPATGAVFPTGSIISIAQGLAGLETSGPGLHFTVEAIDSPGENRLGIASFDVDGDATAGTFYSFEETSVEVAEGGMARLVVRAKGPGRAVHYEIVSETALAWDGAVGDYLPALQPLNFEGDRAVIEVPVFADGIAEEEEVFRVRLVCPDAGATTGPRSRARVTILDGEGPLRLPLETHAAAPTAVDQPFWPGDQGSGGLGYLTDYPGANRPVEVIDNGEWVNIPITPQTGSFSVEFRIQTAGSPINALVGISENPPVAFSDTTAVLRAAPDGYWDGFDDGNNYVREEDLTYSGATVYKARFVVDIPAQTYSLEVEELDSSETTTILQEGSFRWDATVLRYISMFAVDGSLTISHVEVTQLQESIPFQAQAGEFSVEFDLRLSGESDYLPGFAVGISSVATANESAMSALLKSEFVESGDDEYIRWGAWSGGASGSMVLSDLTLVRGEVYSVRFDVNVATQRYSVTVTPTHGLDASVGGAENDAVPYPIFGEGSTGTFRASAGSLSHLNIVGNGVGYKISNLRIPPRLVTTPTGLGSDNPSGWINIGIPRQTGRFSISYDAELIYDHASSGSPINALGALYQDTPAQYSGASVTCRANVGHWDGWFANPLVFTADTELPYAEGETYRITMDVDVGAKKYDITIAPPGGSAVKVIANRDFRNSNVTSLNYLCFRTVTGSLKVSNISEPSAHHSQDAHRQMVGKIDSSLGNGSGVAVADHAVLTAARLVFNSATLSFASDTRWRFRYQDNYPTSAWLVTDYSSAALADRAPGDPTGDSNDVAVLAFRPLKLPEIDNAPALGGYSGYLFDPAPMVGGNPWLTTATERLINYFPAIGGPFAHEEAELQTVAVGSASFSHVGRGLYAAAAVPAPAGAIGSPLFSRHPNGRAYPSAICIGNASGSTRFRTIGPQVAHAIGRANLVQLQLNPGKTIFLAGVQWDPETLDRSLLQAYGLISAEFIPKNANWEVITSVADAQEATKSSTGGKVISMAPGIYTVKLHVAEGFHPPVRSSFRVCISAGQTFVIPSNYYTPMNPESYVSWLERHYDDDQLEDSSVIDPEGNTWAGVPRLVAYAFGLDPRIPLRYPADPAEGLPGLPVIEVDTSTSPPTFVIDFLRRVDSDLTYLIEFSGALDGGWQASLAQPTVTPVASNPGWERVSLEAAPPAGQSGTKFARVRVTIPPF